MKLIFVTEARFTKDISGNIYGDIAFNFELWKRYLEVFSEVIVMARVKYNPDFKGEKNYLSSGEKVSFIELPYFIGPFEYIKKKKELNQIIKKSIESVNAVFICRVPGYVSDIVIKHLCTKKIPFGLEVVGDPWEVFAPGSVKHFLRLYFRWKGYFDLKHNVLKASAVLYVTKKTLQERYPVKSGVFQTFASNVKIMDKTVAWQPKESAPKEYYRLLSIGSLEQMYKAPDIVLKALKILKDSKISCKLVWLGDGVYKKQMESLAEELGIINLVDFAGNVDSGQVIEHLSAADIFILASRTEGLPRAVIEAMSLGLPCVGTRVGGIPELLDEKVLIHKNNPRLLADKIKMLIKKPTFYNEQSSRNLNESLNYRESILRERRVVFYKYLLDMKN